MTRLGCVWQLLLDSVEKRSLNLLFGVLREHNSFGELADWHLSIEENIDLKIVPVLELRQAEVSHNEKYARRAEAEETRLGNEIPPSGV